MYPSTAKDDAVTNLKNAAYDAKDSLNDAASQVGRKARNIYNAASDEFAHASNQVTAEIRANPLRSSAIALGIGVLLGALLRR